MKFCSRLLASVSLLAVLAAGPAAAQDRPGFIIEGTGAFAMGSNPAEFQGEPISFGDYAGGYAALALGLQLDPLWDVKGRFALTTLPERSGEGTDKVGDVLADFDYQTLDLEAGYTPALGDDLQVRYFAGLRGMHVTDSLSYRYIIAHTSQESEFTGAGPRAGLEMSQRFGGGNFGVSAMAAGSVVFGQQRRTATYDFPFPDTITETGNVALVTLEAAAGIDFHMGEQASATIGYRGEVVSGVHVMEDNDTESQLLHGPFVKFKTQF